MVTTTNTEQQKEQMEQPRPPRGRGWVISWTLFVALGLTLSGLGAGWLIWGGSPAATEETTQTTVAASAEPSTLPAQDEPVAAVASSLLPTVVQIRSSSGLGSGVIYDSSGLILTAAHVVGPDSRVDVRLADGDQMTGQVVGTDSNSDIAVIKVDRNGLPAAPLAVETQLEVGQTAVALGSPYGLEQTVTAGVVSAVDRAVLGSDGTVRTAIQTDAPINPGNSGGPLADLEGRVIGINDSIFSQSGGNEGVGFAVPISVAKHVADQLVAGEPIQTAFLGITGTEPTQGVAGVVVTGVVTGSPAEDAGIRVGDLITEVGGKRVESMVELAAEIRSRVPGDHVTIHITRANDTLDLDVTLAPQP